MGWPDLCPVILSLLFGVIIVMRRARPLPDVMWNDLNWSAFVARCSPDAPDCHERSMQAGWSIDPADGLLPVECKSTSFGLLDGRIVAVDYGGAGKDSIS
jgi:hypothetical protein